VQRLLVIGKQIIVAFNENVALGLRILQRLGGERGSGSDALWTNKMPAGEIPAGAERSVTV